MSASTFEDEHASYVGRWTGTSVAQPFNDFTIVNISQRDGAHYLRREDRRAFSPLEGQMTFHSANTFTATVPTWLRAQVFVHGTFSNDGTCPVLCLKIENEGMTGLETKELILKQDGHSEYDKYQVPRVDGVSPDHLPDNADFPSTAGPEALNLTKDQLDGAVQAMMTPPPEHPDNRVEGLLILKDGARIHESYAWGLTPSTPHIAASLTKSIVSLLAGIAYDRGLFALDDVISDTFPTLPTSWAADPPIRLRHVLSMTSGTTFGLPETGRMLTCSCVEEMVLASPRDHGAPGEKYHYDNGLPSLLCVFLERVSGQGIEAFAQQHLFGPLGITNYTWTRMRQRSVDGAPFVSPSGGLSLTLTDLAKIGELLLHKGVYRGRRVVSEEYVALATTQQTREGDYPYGFYFHTNTDGRHVPGKQWEDGYMAVGSGGQVVWVSPAQGLVFVAVGSSWKDFDETPAVLRAFAETVLGGLKK